jgi:hypothetical protein
MKQILLLVYCCLLVHITYAQKHEFDWAKLKTGSAQESVPVKRFFKGKSPLLDKKGKAFFSKVASEIKQLPPDAQFYIGIDAYTERLYRLNTPRLDNIYQYLIRLGCDSIHIRQLLYNSHDKAPPFPGHKPFPDYKGNNIILSIDYNAADEMRSEKERANKKQE